MKKRIIVLTMLVLCLAACSNRKSTAVVSPASEFQVADSLAVSPKYAKGFSVSYLSENVTLLDIQDPEGVEVNSFHYALVQKGSKVDSPQGYTRLETPVGKVICMTSLQLSNFIHLGLTDLVVGVTSTRHLFNETVNRQIKEKKTHKIGIEGNFDTEVIIAINPDVIFISPFKRGGYDAIKNIDIPSVPHLGYKELTPLGQAEWIKVVGLLTGNEAAANKSFKIIEDRYNELKALTAQVAHRPTVMSGQMQSGYWYAPGGKSFLAQMFADAGADYFLKDNPESGGVKIDYETAYEKAADTDYWRMVNSFKGEWSYDVLRAEDERYTDFKPYKNHGVVYCNMTQVPFYERMPIEPHEVLADFIAVFHPELLPDHTPRYYHLVK